MGPDPPARRLLRAAILFIIAYMVYYAKIGPQGHYREPTLLRKIIALYAFNTAVVEVPPPAPPCRSASKQNEHMQMFLCCFAASRLP